MKITSTILALALLSSSLTAQDYYQSGTPRKEGQVRGGMEGQQFQTPSSQPYYQPRGPRYDRYSPQRSDNVKYAADGTVYITAPSGNILQFDIVEGKPRFSPGFGKDFQVEVNQAMPGSGFTFQFPFNTQMYIPTSSISILCRFFPEICSFGPWLLSARMSNNMINSQVQIQMPNGRQVYGYFTQDGQIQVDAQTKSMLNNALNMNGNFVINFKDGSYIIVGTDALNSVIFPFCSAYPYLCLLPILIFLL